MACNNEKPCGNQCEHQCGSPCGGAKSNSGGYLIILVLYILLAILLGSCLYY